MYRVTLNIGDRACTVICYVHLNDVHYRLLLENSEKNHSGNRILPIDGFDEGGDCCTMNCSNPCGLCLYHPIIMKIEEAHYMTIEVNEHIIHKIIEWIGENQC
jgi:hypothetical protein